jgi:hypothetical protein
MNAINHGTYGGYRTHISRGIIPCPECREANAAYQRNYKQRTMTPTTRRPPKPPAPHQKPCKTHGCIRPAKAHQLCKRCLQFLDKHGVEPATSTHPQHIRLPFQALNEYLIRRHAEDTVVGRYNAKHSDNQYAEYCGADRRTYSRWKIDGLSPYVADRVAVHLGTLPIFIWGDQFYADILTPELLEQAA